MDPEDETLDAVTFGKELIQQPTLKLPRLTAVDFDRLLDPPLRLHEDLKEGCGGQLWPAGMVLAKYMLRMRQETIKEKTIIELGAGGGLVGLAIALAVPTFQKPLLLTDRLPMLSLMRTNIALNSLQPSVKAVVYDWGEAPPADVPTYPDIVLAADCVYFEPAFPLLQQTLKDLIGERTVCYFCFKKRRRADMGFVKTMKKMFDVKDTEDDPDKVIWSRENLHLFEVRKKKTV
ncbi:hypothetical protein E6O75_ATG01794 [Venturia nashicola]|uniref:Protein-lysine N-methyltransferase EFM6 n=1 Tax=Venturia nashicola TaxID=86259 RepID=A0A4Z1P0X3_9PEZI|nr:hypothetical protein E6O75_ATG01794 [Venturia nashicola]